MARNDRTCRIEGCDREHKRDLYCCAPHWWALPVQMRDEIWRTYRNGEGLMDEPYLQACENAQAFLEKRPPRLQIGRVT